MYKTIVPIEGMVIDYIYARIPGVITITEVEHRNNELTYVHFTDEHHNRTVEEHYNINSWNILTGKVIKVTNIRNLEPDWEI